MARIFVGVAWPYANGPFHIGHLAGAYLPGDEFARYHRLAGDDVLMVSGSDMHGTPILVTAEKEGSTPATVAQRFHEVNARSFERLGVSFDVFTHTHTALHQQAVQELFLRLLENGHIVRRTEENAFCSLHGRFLPDRYLIGTCPHCGNPSARGDECDVCGRVLEPRQLGSPRCRLDGTPAEFRPSEHFYLDLKSLEGPLRAFLADKDYWRPGVRETAENFLRSGLRATAITRDLEWGVPIPLEGYETKRFYVWFDAVIGYLSASREWAVRAGRPSAWESYWAAPEPVRSYYFIGKDNIFHHTLILPGILAGVGGLHLPYDVPANEWLLIEGTKISKTRGGVEEAFIPALLERYPADVIRFYATLLAPQNHDTELDLDELDRVSEEVLSNQYGNLAQRTLVLTRERESGRVPEPPSGWTTEAEDGVPLRLKTAHREITDAFEHVRLKEALDLVLAEVREANRAFHEARPWQAPESERRKTLFETLWRLKAAAIWLAPILPHSSEALFRMLGYPAPPGRGDWAEAIRPVPPGQPLGEIRPRFPRPSAGGASPQAAAPPGASPEKAGIPLDIRAARVLKVEPHPSADRLYVLTLDAGESEPRTVVAGLRSHYTAEEISGRSVALLANLEPRTIRKVRSQGMVLAAESGESVRLLEIPTAVTPGTRLDGASPPRTITHQEFSETPLRVGRVVGTTGDGLLQIDGGSRVVVAPGRLPVGSIVVVRMAPGDSPTAELLGFGETLPLSTDRSMPPGASIR